MNRMNEETQEYKKNNNQDQEQVKRAKANGDSKRLTVIVILPLWIVECGISCTNPKEPGKGKRKGREKKKNQNVKEKKDRG